MSQNDSLTVDALLLLVEETIEQAGAAEEKATRVQELESHVENTEAQMSQVRQEAADAAVAVRKMQDDDLELAQLTEARGKLQRLPKGEQRATILARISDAEKGIVAGYASQVEEITAAAAQRLAEIEAEAAAARTELQELCADPYVAAVLEAQAQRVAEEEARLDAQREKFAAALLELQGDLHSLGRAGDDDGYARILDVANDIARRAGDVGFTDQVSAADSLAEEIGRRRERAGDERDRSASRDYLRWCRQRAMEPLTVVFKRRDMQRAAVALTGEWDGDGFVVRFTGATGYDPGVTVGTVVDERFLRREEMAYTLRNERPPIPGAIPEEMRFWRGHDGGSGDNGPDGGMTYHRLTSARELVGLVRADSHDQVACGAQIRNGEEWVEWAPDAVPWPYLLPFLRAKNPRTKGSSWAAFCRGLKAAERILDRQSRFRAGEFYLPAEQPEPTDVAVAAEPALAEEAEPVAITTGVDEPAVAEAPQSDPETFGGLSDEAAEALAAVGVGAEALADLQSQPELVGLLVPDHAEEILAWLRRDESEEVQAEGQESPDVDVEFLAALGVSDHVKSLLVQNAVATRDAFAEVMADLNLLCGLSDIGPARAAQLAVAWDEYRAAQDAPEQLSGEPGQLAKQVAIEIGGDIPPDEFNAWVTAAQQLKALLVPLCDQAAIVVHENKIEVLAGDHESSVLGRFSSRFAAMNAIGAKLKEMQKKQEAVNG